MTDTPYYDDGTVREPNTTKYNGEKSTIFYLDIEVTPAKYTEILSDTERYIHKAVFSPVLTKSGFGNTFTVSPKSVTYAEEASIPFLEASFELDVVPEGALPGVFTVDIGTDGQAGTDDDVKVHFSQGNLWYGKVGEATEATWNFETNQYDFTPSANGSWNTEHVSHFNWSRDERVAYSEEESYANTKYGITPAKTDVFFTNATEKTAKSDFTVNGVAGKFRTLSKAEWQYLFSNHDRKWITVCGKTGYALAPDGVSAEVVAESYNTDADWKDAQKAGVVFLPAAGARNLSDVRHIGAKGYYWSSTADVTDEKYAYGVYSSSSNVTPDNLVYRTDCSSVRLVTEDK